VITANGRKIGFSLSVPQLSYAGFGLPESRRRTVRQAVITRIRSRRHAAPSPRAIA